MVQHSVATYESQFLFIFLIIFLHYLYFRVQLHVIFIQQPVYVCDQHTANVNIDLLFEYNSNIDKFDIYSSVKPAFITHILYLKNARKRKCYECLLEKVVFIHNGNLPLYSTVFWW